MSRQTTKPHSHPLLETGVTASPWGPFRLWTVHWIFRRLFSGPVFWSTEHYSTVRSRFKLFVNAVCKVIYNKLQNSDSGPYNKLHCTEWCLKVFGYFGRLKAHHTWKCLNLIALKQKIKPSGIWSFMKTTFTFHRSFFFCIVAFIIWTIYNILHYLVFITLTVNMFWRP